MVVAGEWSLMHNGYSTVHCTHWECVSINCTRHTAVLPIVVSRRSLRFTQQELEIFVVFVSKRNKNSDVAVEVLQKGCTAAALLQNFKTAKNNYTYEGSFTRSVVMLQV